MSCIRLSMRRVRVGGIADEARALREYEATPQGRRALARSREINEEIRLNRNRNEDFDNTIVDDLKREQEQLFTEITEGTRFFRDQKMLAREDALWDEVRAAEVNLAVKWDALEAQRRSSELDEGLRGIFGEGEGKGWLPESRDPESGLDDLDPDDPLGIMKDEQDPWEMDLPERDTYRRQRKAEDIAKEALVQFELTHGDKVRELARNTPLGKKLTAEADALNKRDTALREEAGKLIDRGRNEDLSHDERNKLIDRANELYTEADKVGRQWAGAEKAREAWERNFRAAHVPSDIKTKWEKLNIHYEALKGRSEEAHARWMDAIDNETRKRRFSPTSKQFDTIKNYPHHKDWIFEDVVNDAYLKIYRPDLEAEHRAIEVVLNDSGGLLLDHLMGRDADRQNWAGLALNSDHVMGIIGNLDYIIKESAEGGSWEGRIDNYQIQSLTLLRDALQRGQEHIAGVALIKADLYPSAIDGGPRNPPDKNAQKTRAHEQVHAGQYFLAAKRGNLISNHIKNFDRNSMPHRSKIMEGLTKKMGYTDYPGVDIVEPPAFIATGDHARLGLTIPEAMEYMDWYFREVAKQHGAEALNFLDSSYNSHTGEKSTLVDTLRRKIQDVIGENEPDPDRAEGTGGGEPPEGSVPGMAGRETGRGIPESAAEPKRDDPERIDPDRISLEGKRKLKPYYNKKQLGNMTPVGQERFFLNLGKAVGELRKRGEDPARKVGWADIKAVAASEGVDPMDLQVPSKAQYVEMAGQRLALEQLKYDRIQDGAHFRQQLREMGQIDYNNPEQIAKAEALKLEIANADHDAQQAMEKLLPFRSWAGRNLNFQKILLQKYGTDPTFWAQRANDLMAGHFTPEQRAKHLSEIHDILGNLVSADRELRRVKDLMGAATDPAEIKKLQKQIAAFQKKKDLAARALGRKFTQIQTTPLLEAVSGMRISWLFSAVWKGLSRNAVGGGLNLMAHEAEAITNPLTDAFANLGNIRTGAGWRRSAAMGIPVFNRGMLMGLKGAKHGIVEWLQHVRYGPLPGLNSKQGNIRGEMNLGFDTDTFKGKWGKRIIQNPVVFIHRLYGGSDQPLWHFAYQRNVYSFARAKAINERNAKTLPFKADGTQMTWHERANQIMAAPWAHQEVDMNASFLADVLTFHNKNPISNAIAGARRASGAGGNFIIDIPLPVERTPTNIFLHVFKTQTPGGVGAIPGLYKFAKSIINKDFSPAAQRDFVHGMNSVAVGQTLVGFGMYLASRGLASPVAFNQEERDRMREANIPEGAIWIPDFDIHGKVIGGKWKEMAGFAPIMTAIIIGASVYHSSAQKDDISKIAGYAGLAASTVTEMPLMSPAKEAFSALDIRDNAADPLERMETFMGKNVASFIPFSSAMRDIAKATDTGDDGNQVLRRQSGFMGPIMGTVPGLRSSLPKSPTPLGRTSGEARRQAFSPTNYRTDRTTNDPFQQELQALDFPLQRPDVGSRKDFPTDQLALRSEEAGKRINEAMRNVYASSEYQNLPPADDPGGKALRTQMLQKAYSDALSDYNALDLTRRKKDIAKAQESILGSRYQSDPNIAHERVETDAKSFVINKADEFTKSDRFQALKQADPAAAADALKMYRNRLQSMVSAPTDQFAEMRTQDQKNQLRDMETDAMGKMLEQIQKENIPTKLADMVFEMIRKRKEAEAKANSK
jgi:hypothetical protein